MSFFERVIDFEAIIQKRDEIMVLNKDEWTPFRDLQDQIEHYRRWGLISPKGTKLPPIMVVDGYYGVPEPCTVVGYQGDNWATIRLDDGIHVIHGEFLAEMQPKASQKLPRGTFFSEVLADYVVLDIETTGFDRNNDKIIEIAAIRYAYGKETSRFHTMVNPNSAIPPEITSLTGISEIDIINVPYIEDITASVLQFVGDSAIIGHNAVSFDVPFIEAQTGHEFHNTVVDTLPMARAAYPLLNCHKLEYLKSSLKLTDGSSHRALADVETTNTLLWACLAPRRYESEMWSEYLRTKTTSKASAVTTKPSKRSRSSNPRHKHIDASKIVPTNTAIDANNPLYGKGIAFTGDLSISREEAMQLAVDSGAILKSSVSKKVSYLVTGEQDQMAIGGSGISTKEAKAREINQSGKAHIEIISEEEFRALIGYKEPDQNEPT